MGFRREDNWQNSAFSNSFSGKFSESLGKSSPFGGIFVCKKFRSKIKLQVLTPPTGALLVLVTWHKIFRRLCIQRNYIHILMEFKTETYNMWLLCAENLLLQLIFIAVDFSSASEQRGGKTRRVRKPQLLCSRRRLEESSCHSIACA